MSVLQAKKEQRYGPTKFWDRNSAYYPFRADVEIGTVPMITRVIEPSLVINLLDRKPQRWAFTKRSHRDQFVAAWKHKGARNA